MKRKIFIYTKNVLISMIAIIFGGLILVSLFFFDANPSIWIFVFLFFYIFEEGTELFKEKKYLKAFVLYLLSLIIFISLVYFITTLTSIYLLIIIPLGYIPYYLYKKF